MNTSSARKRSTHSTTTKDQEPSRSRRSKKAKARSHSPSRKVNPSRLSGKKHSQKSLSGKEKLPAYLVLQECCETCLAIRDVLLAYGMTKLSDKGLLLCHKVLLGVLLTLRSQNCL